jgi:zinc protease
MHTVAAAQTIPAFHPASLALEKQAQLAAIRSDLDRPLTIASGLMRHALFPNHPYQFPLSGTEKSVSAVEREHLIQLQQTCLTAGNTVLAVYGDVEDNAVVDAAERMFAAMPQGPRLFTEPRLVTPIASSVRIEESSGKEQAVVVFSYPTTGLYSPDTLALELLSDACSDMSSRFFNRIREDLGAAYSVGASRLMGVEGGCFYFYALTSAEMADAVEDAMRAEIEFLGKNGLEAPEFVRAKRSWNGSQKNRLQSTSAQAEIHSLDEVQGFGWDHAHRQPALMEQIDNDQLRSVAQRHFLELPHVVVRLLPSAK